MDGRRENKEGQKEGQIIGRRTDEGWREGRTEGWWVFGFPVSIFSLTLYSSRPHSLGLLLEAGER